MKKLMLCALMLMPLSLFGQEITKDGYGVAAIDAWNFKSYTNFTATSDDTSGYLAIGGFPDILTSREVILIAVATDSVATDLQFIGRNRTLTSVTESHTAGDSLVGTSNTSNIFRIVIKDAATNLLEGLDEFRVGNVFRASGQGTTTGRTLKFYLKVVR